ncbi:MAG: MotA/TolQ/ExbB proton channel family protein [Sandaracinaceae bacterium]|nr:MotA/TolQ/ExbB proton channel family protein [Sandaracinaceae bacterium]MDW8246389.1 MotA/TolQ/ExbB proton channel family protein [Sandaracinaceae bacterium]
MEKIWHALRDGAPFSYINVCVLAFVVAIIVERFVFLLTKYRKIDTTDFMAQIRTLVQRGDIDRAIRQFCQEPLPLPQLIHSGLSHVQKGEDAVIAAMEEKWAELAPHLEKRTAWLWTLANIATLIGLLGTISGLIRSFGAVGSADASQRAALLAAGISEAMWNTALGLGIAVLCMVFHLILHTMTKNIKHEMELAAMKLENIIANRSR